MTKLGYLSTVIIGAALVGGIGGATYAAGLPTFSFSNVGAVTLTESGGVYSFSAVPVDVTDSTLTLGSTGTLTGGGTSTDYNVTLLDNGTTYDIITGGSYFDTGAPFDEIAATDSSGTLDANYGVSGTQLAGTYTPTNPAPEAASGIALGSLLLAGGILLGFKKKATLSA